MLKGMRGRRAPFNGMRGKRGPTEDDYEASCISFDFDSSVILLTTVDVAYIIADIHMEFHCKRNCKMSNTNNFIRFPLPFALFKF